MTWRIPTQRVQVIVALLLMANTLFIFLKRCITFKGSRLARNTSAFIIAMKAEASLPGWSSSNSLTTRWSVEDV